MAKFSLFNFFSDLAILLLNAPGVGGGYSFVEITDFDILIFVDRSCRKITSSSCRSRRTPCKTYPGGNMSKAPNGGVKFNCIN